MAAPTIVPRFPGGQTVLGGEGVVNLPTCGPMSTTSCSARFRTTIAGRPAWPRPPLAAGAVNRRQAGATGCGRASASTIEHAGADRGVHRGRGLARRRRRGGGPILPERRDPRGKYRFFENRQKYLPFVHTCSEKRVIAQRVALELSNIHPRPPAIRLFDAGCGDGTVLARVLRSMHSRLPADAVLCRRQGTQPGRRPPDAGQDPGPAVRSIRRPCLFSPTCIMPRRRG
ncbi:MAG: hypothetical protein MZV49_22110 [Rhodopseudomonas palustris]|nr:hypothetical protein [Rhodopseudomonas palustris]